MLRFPDFNHTRKLKTIGVLTSGGDAPGMNAAIRAVVRYGIAHGCRVVGISRGYSGLLEKSFQEMKASSVANIIQRGGTILKTDRCPDWHKASCRKKAAKILRAHKIQALVVIGGDGSFRGAHALESETGILTVGVPGTIDNDINGTDETIGFDTAVNTAVEAIDRIRDTASSHDRVFLVEVMGRNSGFIATEVGIGGGAETVLLPSHGEKKERVEEICNAIDRGIKRGKSSSIIIVAEGPKPGRSNLIAQALKRRGHEAKVCILGHIQRGGRPTAYDRLLASSLGAASVGYLLSGKSNCMVALQNNHIVSVPFTKMVEHENPLPEDLLQLAQTLAT